MKRFSIRNIIIVPFVVFSAIWLNSCKAPREIVRVEAKPISTNKLLKKVEQNAFDYDFFTIKRINCQFSNSETKTNFKVSLKAQKDQIILVSISKINIPVGRLLLTPDSVKYVNYLERNYFLDDYSYLSQVLNIDLDFKTVQAIISNNVFLYQNDSKNKNLKSFNSFIDSGMYVLQSENERKISKIEEKGKSGKNERRVKRADEDAFIVQRLFFNPDNFTLAKMIIDDKLNGRKVEMNFDDFSKIRNKQYPGAIDLNFISTENTVSLKAKMSGFSDEKITSLSFRIPDKYELIEF